MSTASDFLVGLAAKQRAAGGKTPVFPRGSPDAISVALDAVRSGDRGALARAIRTPLGPAPKPLPKGGFKAAITPARKKPAIDRFSRADEQHRIIFGEEPAPPPRPTRIVHGRVIQGSQKPTGNPIADAIFGSEHPAEIVPSKKTQKVEASGFPGIPAGALHTTIDTPIQAMLAEGKSGSVMGPIGSFLNVAGSVLMRPESAAAFGAEAISSLARGDVGGAGTAAKHALSTLVPGGQAPTTYSEVLRRHGVDLPTGVGPVIDIAGDPVNLAFPESIAARPIREAGEQAGKLLSKAAGVPGEDVLEATARTVHRGTQGPTFLMPEGADEAVAAAETRLAKAAAKRDVLKAEYDKAVERQATPKQVARLERRRAKAQADLDMQIEALPGTPAQKRRYVETFGQPATGREATTTGLGTVRGRAAGTPRQHELHRAIFGEDPVGAPLGRREAPAGRAALGRKPGGLARPTPGELPYPIVPGHDAALAKLEELTGTVRGIVGKKAVSVEDVMNLQRQVSEMSAHIDALPGPRGRSVPRVPGTPEAAQVDRGAVQAMKPVEAPPRVEPPPGEHLRRLRENLGVKDADVVLKREVDDLAKTLELTGPGLSQTPRRQAMRKIAKKHKIPMDTLERRVVGVENAESAARAGDTLGAGRAVEATPEEVAAPEMVPAGPAPRQLPQAARLEPPQGLTAAQSRAANKMITAAQKLVKIRQGSTTVPPRQLVRLGQDFEGARAAFQGLMEQTRSAVREAAAEGGRAVRGRVPAPPSPVPLQRAVARAAGGKSGLADILDKKVPSAPGIGKAGRRLGKSETKLQRAEANLKTVLQRQRKLGPGGFHEARSFIEHAAARGHAEYEAKMASPIGLRVNFGLGKYKKGVAVPFVRGDRARRMRETVAELTGGTAQKYASRYAGRAHMGAATAVQASDQWKGGSLVERKHNVMELARKHKIGGDARLEERESALWELEGTGKATTPAARALAADLRKLMDKRANELTDAGVLNASQIRADYMPIRFIPESRLSEDLIKPEQTVHIGRQRFRLPGATAMEKARQLPSVAKALELHPGLIETDPLRLMLVYEEEVVRAMAEAALQRTLVRQFGHVIEEGDAVPEGYARLEGARFIPSNAVVETDAAETLKSLLEEEKAFNAPPGRRGQLFSKLPSGRKIMGWWKNIKLKTPAYDIRNMKDEIMLSLQSGVNPVAAAKHGVRTMQGKAVPLGGKSGLSAAEAKFLARRMGVTTSGYVGGEVTRELNRKAQQRQALETVRYAPRRARVLREDVQRSGTFAHQLRKGRSPYEAARRARELHFDYADPGIQVERWRRSMMGAPFGTWTTKNIPRQLKLLGTRPGQLATRERILTALNQEAGGPLQGILPDWTQQEQPAPIPGLGWLNYRDPVVDLNTITPFQANAEGRNEFLTNLLGLFAPLPQAAIESASAATGHPFSLRRRMEQGPNAQADPLEAQVAAALGIGGPTSTMGAQGQDVAGRGVPRSFHAIYQALSPALGGAAGRLLASDEGTRSQSRGQALAQALTGAQVLPFNSPQDAKYAMINKQNEVDEARKQVRRDLRARMVKPSDEADAQLQRSIAVGTRKQQELTDLMKQIQAAGIKIGGR